MPARPNILFIMTDDQGYWALGCSGTSELRTPNIDRLAAQGVRFSNFYCVSPVCSPARASLLTGQIPSGHGVHDWILGGNDRDAETSPAQRDRGAKGGDPIAYLDGRTTYVDLLADAGYVCGLAGKWHLGHSARPQKGFSYWRTLLIGSSRYYDAPMYEADRLVQTKGYLTDVITDYAIDFLDRHVPEEAPFYLSVHYNAPHRPWKGNHPQDVVDSYDGCAFDEVPNDPAHPWSTGGELDRYEDRDERRENLKHYYAAITEMDRNVGRLLAHLEEKGLAEDTVVVFTSDNGFNCGQHGLWGKGNASFPQNMYETSVKVPFIMRYPRGVEGGRVLDDLVSGYDVFPTILDLAGIAHPQPEAPPGASMLPLATGANERGERRAVVFDEYGAVRMIRSGDWKYIHRYDVGPSELFNLADDPDERHDQMGTPVGRERGARLLAVMEEWFGKYAEAETDGRRYVVYGNGQVGLLRGRAPDDPSPFHGRPSNIALRKGWL